MSFQPYPTFNPITNSQQWHKFVCNGVKSPGTIPKQGLRGFKRETGWDKQRGKGTQGARLVLTTQPPMEGTIVLQLITPRDFADWDTFVSKVLAIDAAKQKAEGLSFYYPGLASTGLTRVVIAHYSPIEHMGAGMYHSEIMFLEWSPPPPKSIAQPVATSAPDQANDQQVPLDPRIQDAQDDVENAMAEGATEP